MGYRIWQQQGFTLIEVMVALFVGLFLLAGLFTILQNTRRTSTNQSSLTQLQDEQRMAMSLINDVVQNAGYFDSNAYQSATTAWPVTVVVVGTGTNLLAGQPVTGTHTATTSPDILVVRYSTTGTDGVINCTGATSAVATTFVNVFSVNTGTKTLQCNLDGQNAVPLVGPLTTTGASNIGVTNMQIWYGVSTQAGTNNVDTYMTASQVTTAAAWSTITSLRVTLTFNNPLYGQPGFTATTNQYVYFTRVIALQGRTGVIAAAL